MPGRIEKALRESNKRNSYYLGKKQVKRAKVLYAGIIAGGVFGLFLEGLNLDILGLCTFFSFVCLGLYILGKKNVKKGLKEFEREAIYMSIQDLNDME